ncbi:hypothetical protein [Kangiella sp.]|uniref:hypothetical protein n=1 Tax=Kangiella sp. TaxID=1920245 RepID=UPI00198F422C|nr:hypothetical protein [Kangiella sp.]MBD3654382.1 hypothetical protein [Kangiella sp.]
MTEPETSSEKRDRKLKELEGKNIAHYSVMLSSYISTRVDANKAIFTFSLAAIGLLLAAYEKPTSSACYTNIFYSLSMLAFVIAVISTLFIYVANSKAIEAYIRSKEESKRDFKLQAWMYINYIAFGLGVLFTAVLGILNIYE